MGGIKERESERRERERVYGGHISPFLHFAQKKRRAI
jgi:hypothetical protein